MAINFPNNPVLNGPSGIHTVGSTRWTWNGTSWIRSGTPGPQGPSGISPWKIETVGISTATPVGFNTTSIEGGLAGVGNSFQGMYISNGMFIMDNHLEGNHYIGTAYNGLMAGPVTVNGSLTIDGVWVVV